MESENQTVIKEFILIGLSQDQRTQILLFVLFLFMYLLTIFGNISLICAVLSNPRMHTPMYYFLCQLSFLDLFYSTSTVPKMLVNLLSAEGGRISYIGCITQMNIGLFLGETECILLAVMAYDRYVAICFPLRYMAIMSWRICKIMSIIVWIGNFASSVLLTASSLRPICKGNQIDHFVCEIIALMKLFCGDTSSDEAKIIFSSFFTLLVPFVFILASYMCIIASILKIHSVDGRTKAFSTCGSHLTVVLMFYGTSMSLYLGPRKLFSKNHKYISVFYGVVTPMLNPLIYSLRNHEVKSAVRKVFNI